MLCINVFIAFTPLPIFSLHAKPRRAKFRVKKSLVTQLRELKGITLDANELRPPTKTRRTEHFHAGLKLYLKRTRNKPVGWKLLNYHGECS